VRAAPGPGPGRRGRKDDTEAGATPPAPHLERSRSGRWPPLRNASRTVRTGRPGQSGAKGRHGRNEKGPPGPVAPQPASGRSSRQPAQEPAQLVGRALQAAVHGSRARHHHQVHPWRGQLRHSPVTLAYPTLDPISHSGLSHLLADGDSQPRAAGLGRRRTPGQGQQKIARSRDPATPFLDDQEVGSPCQSLRASEPVPGRAHRLLFGDADRELLAALAAAAAQHLATRGAAHPLAKPMGALAALTVWLKGPLHDVLRGTGPARPWPPRGQVN
jgi:hypothetical protein